MAASHLESFYHLHDTDLADHACRGLACFVARGNDPARWERACGDPTRVYCLGKCNRSPAVGSDPERPVVAIHAREAIVRRHLAGGGAVTLDADRLILEDNPQGVIEALAIAGYAVGAHRGYIYCAPSTQKRERGSPPVLGKRSTTVCSGRRFSAVTSPSTCTSRSDAAAISVVKRRRCSTPSRAGGPRCALDELRLMLGRWP